MSMVFAARLRAGVAGAAVAWSLLAVPPVVGAAPVALCQLESRMEADDGFWFTRPTKTEIHSVYGTIACVGFINGREALGQPVPFAQLFRTQPGSTCAYGSGTGSWEFSLPLSDGTTMPVSGAQEGGWATPGFWVTGNFNNQAVRGGGVVRADPEYSDENCVTKGLRHWFDVGQLLVGP